MHQVEYAYYEGDQLVAIGTAFQLARSLGVRKETIKFYATPSYHRRMRTVKKPSGKRKYTVRIIEDEK